MLGLQVFPLEVMEEAQQEMLNFHNTGMGVMEMSHRNATFEQILAQAEHNIRQILSETHNTQTLTDRNSDSTTPSVSHCHRPFTPLSMFCVCCVCVLPPCVLVLCCVLMCSGVPVGYSVLFMQGGGTLQFSAVPLNLLGSKASAAYLVTGAWSQAAAEEAKKFVPNVHIVASTAPNFSSFPSSTSYQIPSDCAYLHYCQNETIHGVQATEIPSTSIPLVVDCSSSFLSQPIDVSAHTLLYAGAQKNVGPAGVTIVIVRTEALKAHPPHPFTPLMLDYSLLSSKQSMYNTPPTFTIYMVGLVLQWIRRQGGVEAMEERSRAKSGLVYSAIDDSEGFYEGRVQQKESRSRMNVTFRLREKTLEEALVKEAELAGMEGIAGHRSVGGIRVSLYNAVTVEDVHALVAFLHTFQQKHQSK